ncbi:hypothetical protein [Profundibacter sp.]
MVDLRQEIENARSEITMACDLLEAAADCQSRALTALERAIEGSLKEGFKALPQSAVPVTSHRKQHRAGRICKIETDPELQAFIRARIDRLTYVELAREVANYFPPDRRVSRSSIQRWWKRQLSPETQSSITNSE